MIAVLYDGYGTACGRETPLTTLCTLFTSYVGCIDGIGYAKVVLFTNSVAVIVIHLQVKMRFRALGSTGLQLSILGMGGSGYGNVYGKYNEERAISALRSGLKRGINYIDTAYWYGQGKSETFLGKALKGVPRDTYFIGTKVGRYERDFPRMFDFSAEMVTKSTHDSLKRLQVDYVDILQIHDVEFAPTIEQITKETLPALQRLKEQGLCRFIGITGYTLSVLRRIIEQSTVPIDCVLSYCRLTLNDSSLTDDFEFFKSRNVGIINASPVGMGLLTSDGVQVHLILDSHPPMYYI